MPRIYTLHWTLLTPSDRYVILPVLEERNVRFGEGKYLTELWKTAHLVRVFVLFCFVTLFFLFLCTETTVPLKMTLFSRV